MSTTIEKFTSDAIAQAETNASTCIKIINRQGLAEAVEYCKRQNIQPPQCSLTAHSPSAELLRTKAARMLSDSKWWATRLKRKAIQDFEHYQMLEGKVRHLVSDELMKYNAEQKNKHITICSILDANSVGTHCKGVRAHK